jgi:hypothetical protein
MLGGTPDRPEGLSLQRLRLCARRRPAMPGTSYDADSEGDPQDQAETFDEANVTGGEGDVSLGGDSPVTPGEDMRTFEELPDVEDVTRAEGDADDDEAIALDADEFDPDAMTDNDLEEDDEFDYHAATEEREDDIDGQGPENGSMADGFNEDRIDARSSIDGLAEDVEDADQVEGGEDDVTNFQSKALDDDDLQRLGYSDAKGRAKPS